MRWLVASFDCNSLHSFKLTNADDVNCGTSVSIKFDEKNIADIALFHEFFNDQ
jgi:hypothetical protein